MPFDVEGYGRYSEEHEEHQYTKTKLLKMKKNENRTYINNIGQKIRKTAINFNLVEVRESSFHSINKCNHRNSTFNRDSIKFNINTVDVVDIWAEREMI